MMIWAALLQGPWSQSIEYYVSRCGNEPVVVAQHQCKHHHWLDSGISFNLSHASSDIDQLSTITVQLCSRLHGYFTPLAG